jgi:hypothetical protein
MDMEYTSRDIQFNQSIQEWTGDLIIFKVLGYTLSKIGGLFRDTIEGLSMYQ